MSAPRLIFNPRTLRPAKRVDRARSAERGSPQEPRCEYPQLGGHEPQGGVDTSEANAYWRGFADGAREAQATTEKEEMAMLSRMATYYTKTRGF